MKIQLPVVVSAFVAISAVYVIGTASTPTPNDKSRERELAFLAHFLTPLKQLEPEEIAAWFSASGLDKSLPPQSDSPGARAFDKRQATWDMDYGWGGGRFGKRGILGQKRYDIGYLLRGARFGKNKDSNKRYDRYGVGGRFGRSASKPDSLNP